MSDLKNERDDFWDIEKLVPKKKSTSSPFLTRNVLTDYTVKGEDKASDNERKLTFEPLRRAEFTPEDSSYVPGGGLIKRVTIKRYADKYDFYGNFRKAALIYYDYKTERCDFVPFYSYMPQYSQLNSLQKSYYFYWRDSIRRGKYIKSDYSYIYLFVYEILNLPDKIKPEQGIKLLCRLWREYRTSLTRLDSYFTVWVQDYCLVYNLPCPFDEIGNFVFDVIGTAGFKEFYLSDVDSVGIDGVDTLIAYLSDYDWRKGKFASGENAENYKRYMQGAMYAFICDLNVSGALSSRLNSERISRDAFPHSLCTHAVKCRLEIEYVALAHDTSTRLLITSAVRYTENKLRALFGIKSRLAVKDFPDSARAVIDGYFDRLITSERLRRVKETVPEYERLYDAPKETLSFDGADEIERLSWSTTARLVVEEAEDLDPEPPKIIAKEAVPVTDGEIFGLSKSDSLALMSLYRGESRLVDDTLAERINNAACDSFGDVILEYTDGGYVIIEDYEEEIEKWLQKQ